MERKINTAGDTPEQAADSIADALDFLYDEANAAGLPEVAEAIHQASTKVKRRRQAPEAPDPAGPGGPAVETGIPGASGFPDFIFPDRRA